MFLCWLEWQGLWRGENIRHCGEGDGGKVRDQWWSCGISQDYQRLWHGHDRSKRWVKSFVLKERFINTNATHPMALRKSEHLRNTQKWFFHLSWNIEYLVVRIHWNKKFLYWMMHEPWPVQSHVQHPWVFVNCDIMIFTQANVTKCDARGGDRWSERSWFLILFAGIRRCCL